MSLSKNLEGEYPLWMYHAIKPPVQVLNGAQEKALGHDWSREYIHQEYPKWKYHRTGKSLVVKDAEEEAALGEGWGDSPAGPFGLQGADPLRRFDSWDLEGLSPEARGRIRRGVGDAHADVIESGPDHDSRVRQASMRKVFGLFAEEYLNTGLLTESIIAEAIPQMVYDVAVSGGWQTGTLKANGTCTLEFGHYWVPNDVPKMMQNLFEVQVWRLRAKLEESQSAKPTPLPSSVLEQQQPLPRALRKIDLREPCDPKHYEVVAERGARRKAVVDPILKQKRWKRGRLVTESGVGKATVYGYLDGTRSKIAEENRKALADCLGLKPEELPD
jgi:hypothetical protein